MRQFYVFFMKIFQDRRSLSDWVASRQQQNKSIGFVPTMGALHRGHISLIENSLRDNDFTICSVFVNPTQFNDSKDLEKYPRTQKADIEILEKNNCDAVFFPTIEEMYPNGTKTRSYSFDGIENEMEGKYRPGHFDGVATIVHKLFELTRPTRAYFGQKDFQQLRIVQTLCAQIENAPEIIGVPIYREADGLAMSSRNCLLTPQHREAAPLIYQCLTKAKEMTATHSVQEIRQEIENAFSKSDLELEYFLISEEQQLKSIENWTDFPTARGFIAAYAGKVRLIDNLKLK